MKPFPLAVSVVVLVAEVIAYAMTGAAGFLFAAGIIAGTNLALVVIAVDRNRRNRP